MHVMVFLAMDDFQSVGATASVAVASAAMPSGSAANPSKVSATDFNISVSCSVLKPLPVELAITISAANLTNCFPMFHPFIFLGSNCNVLLQL